MASRLKLNDLLTRFSLSESREILFQKITPSSVSDWLKQTLNLAKNIPLISEKVRSEVIVMPILMELAKQNKHSFSIYSGATLDVEDDLKGECDFILSKQPNTYQIKAPIFALIEAKDNDIHQGIPQCVAQMIGARLFNEKHNNDTRKVYGCVTTAEVWQ